MNFNNYFDNEREAFEYRDEIWFEYKIMGTVYACTKDNSRGYSVEFEEE